MLEALKQTVYEENLKLVRHGLVILTWGNVSGIDREHGYIVIKPSGVPYDALRPAHMVVTTLDGTVVEGTLRPSSDLPTHLFLYKAFPTIGGVVHTHSLHATAWAQAGLSIPALGTTHADAFYGDIPCTRSLSEAEIQTDYEHHTGKVIAEAFQSYAYDAIPGVLVKNHGPFTWGPTPEKAVENAVTLEAVAKMAELTLPLRADVPRVAQALLDKHYFRKHGSGAYYGQK